MIEIKNENYKAYKKIRLFNIIPITLLTLITYLLISSTNNNQMDGYMVGAGVIVYISLIAVINYIINFSHSRFFSLEITDEIIYISRNTKRYEVKKKEIKRLLYVNLRDISGSTDYLMIVTKGLKRNIFLSNYKSKSSDFSSLIGHPLFEHKKIIKFNNRLIGDAVFVGYCMIFLTV